MAVSKLAPGTADEGLLDRSTRLLKLPLLEVSSCSLVVQSLATCTNTHHVTYACTHITKCIVNTTHSAECCMRSESPSLCVAGSSQTHPPNSRARYGAAELCYDSVRLRADVEVSDVHEAVYLSLERLQLSNANHICAGPSLQVLHNALVLFVLCRAQIKSKLGASHELWCRLDAHCVAAGDVLVKSVIQLGCTGLHFLKTHFASGAVDVKPSSYKP